ncbi:uncharacterized protein EI90DRAFT_2987706 [Cantharellus anzutake]|uniref:uncharacterized protein n=1 Tax=Cantharellus anzutake TaxID=1750568 RepID=UPI001905F4A8|nr:uncharacterized protein EI90DRAFT_2987706 [Cantharellus anzutake]KAF8342550.1 hypothetical protein EI90DRAFT_2987706 [Cantharellus anzutake]
MYLQTACSAPYSSKTITSSLRSSLIERISQWAFNPHELTEDQVLACVFYLFELLFTIEGMGEDLGLEAESLTSFLLATKSIYNRENAYHNFRHALDVLQSMYIFLNEGGCVPHISILLTPSARRWTRNGSSRGHLQGMLSNVDVFTLFVAALGHDVGHPGVNNAFMKNASTPVSVIYDHNSALEQMHCALLLQLMRNTGLGHLITSFLPPTNGQETVNIRDLLVGTILATDMGIHGDWMRRFREHIEGPTKCNKLLVCQALLKCADISNPSRPHEISEVWSTSLMYEWSKQAELERSLALPVSVPPNLPPSHQLTLRISELSSSSKKQRLHISNLASLSPSDVQAAVHQAKGQLFFINGFSSPLFTLVSAYIPEIRTFSDCCLDNKALWEQRLKELDEHAKTIASRSSATNNAPLLSTFTFPSRSHSTQGYSNASTPRHQYPHKPTSLVSLSPLYLPSVSRSSRPSSISSLSTTSSTSSYHSALSALDGVSRPCSPRPRNESWSTAMSLMVIPGDPFLNIDGDSWRASSIKRSHSTNRVYPNKDDLDLDSEDRMNDIRRIGKGLEAMRAAYRSSCRKKPGKGLVAIGATMDDGRFRRRWSVAWPTPDRDSPHVCGDFPMSLTEIGAR